MADQKIALRVRGLSKTYSRPAVKQLDLAIGAGEFYGLLGPNGAGKTTTLKMIVGLLAPDAGSIEIFGVDARANPKAAKQMVAWLPDEPMLYDKLTPLEYLEFVAGLWGMDAATAQRRARDLLERLELWAHRDERCEGFSRGMKQKAALAGALIHDPKLLILDEPLSGLDAAIARQVKDLLLDRARGGCTIILTTHVLEVAERLVDRIGIIRSGELLIEGSLEDLRRRSGRRDATLEAFPGPRRQFQRRRSRRGAGARGMTPGSPLWLLRHEIRLQWRTSGRKRNVAVTAALAQGFLHLLAFPLAFALRYAPPLPPVAVYAMVSGGALFISLMMLSTALVASVQTIFARGDIDLLLSSPVPPRSIILVRAGAIALSVSSAAAILGLPFANALGLVVNPRWFIAYLALPALALLVTTLSLAIALVLFRLIGPRRTRVFAQVLAGLLGVATFLVMQLPNMVRSAGGDAVTHKLQDVVTGVALPAADSLVWLPARALTGDPLPFAVGFLLSVGLFILVAHWFAERFIAVIGAAAATGSSRANRSHAPRRFRTGTVSVMRRKELRLIARDPWLLTSVARQLVFMVPLAATMWKYGVDQVTFAWLLLVLIAGNLASAFAWLSVSGEDAPDLLAGSPVRSADALRAKLEAALLLVGLAMLLPVGAATYFNSRLGVTLAICCAGAAMSSALLQFLHPQPGRRSDFNKRAQGRLVLGLAEFLLGAAWAATAAGVLAFGPWMLIVAPLLLALPALDKLLEWLDGEPAAAMA